MTATMARVEVYLKQMRTELSELETQADEGLITPEEYKNQAAVIVACCAEYIAGQ